METFVWQTTMQFVVLLIFVGFLGFYIIAKKFELEKILIMRSVNFMLANLIIIFVFLNGIRESRLPSRLPSMYDLSHPTSIIVSVIVPYVLLLFTSIFVRSKILNIIMLALGSISVVVNFVMVSTILGVLD